MDADDQPERRSGRASWAHAPSHHLSEFGTYMVTAATYRKCPIFTGDERLSALCKGLRKYANVYHWNLEAWAVFPNHYHFIGHPVDKGGAETLRTFLAHFHKKVPRG